MTQTRSAQRMTQTLTGMDLTFAYDGRDVLSGVTASVRAGRVTAVIGPSGSGKTTLLWILAGLLPPKSGRVIVAEAPDGAPADSPDGAAADSPDGAPAQARPAGGLPLSVGMVFQGSALWEHLTAEEHLWLVLAGKGLARRDRRRRVDETLAKLRLATLARRRPGQLSGGERRRLAIARALVADPAWLFLDEPLVHLDGPTRAEVFELLRETLTGLHAGVLMATHDAAEAMRLADEIVVLTDGSVAQQGTPEAVYRRPVSLDVARLLGPAGELAGDAAGGVLTSGGRAVLKDVPASLRGPQRLILRPEDVAFHAAGDGTATVRRCDFDGRDWLLTVDAGGTDIFVRHAEKIAAGTAGWLHLVMHQH